MGDKDLKNLCFSCQELTKEVGQFILSEMGKVERNQIEEKDLNSLVSYVDTSAEKKIVEKLSIILPHSSFLTEEETVEQKPGKYRWIIDPLDGTTNFLHQLPYFAISIALEVKNKIVMGTVYDPNKDECFYSWENSGAYLNGKPISVSNTSSLKSSLISTGFPYRDFSHEVPYFKVFKYFMKNTRGIRRFGAAALDLCYVACGRYEAFYEYGLSPWDVAGGAFIAKEAGGKVYDFRGGNNFLMGGEIIAVNSNLAKIVLTKINNSFYPRITVR